MKLSARNRINARVVGVTRGEATANVVLDAGGTRLVASITVEAADELDLVEGQEVIEKIVSAPRNRQDKPLKDAVLQAVVIERA